MKTFKLIAIFLTVFAISCSSDDDDGSVSGSAGCNGSNIEYETVQYQGETYKTVKIGTQTWMAENLRYAAPGSKCGESNSINLSDANTEICDTYGRLYDYETAMEVCPEGWHLPSDADWKILTNFVGANAGTKLKATSGWEPYKNVPSGTDKCGFSALPGGYGYDGIFVGTGKYGLWWSNPGNGSNKIYYRRMNYGYEIVDWSTDDKDVLLLSVRCVRD